MADPNTVRGLSWDGGGMRGYIQVIYLILFIERWGINPAELYKYFTYFAGTSIGGIQALAYSVGVLPSTMKSFFRTYGKWIFSNSSYFPSSRPSTLTKINTIIGGPLSDPTFYPSDVEGIGTKLLYDKMKEIFGDKTLADCLLPVLITSFEKNDTDPAFAKTTNTPVYFSNSTIWPILTGRDIKIVDVAMATSAAPLYFQAWQIGENSYIDGCTAQNNPSSIGLALGKGSKPGSTRSVLVSLGTGLGDVGFPEIDPEQMRKEFYELHNDPKAYAEKWRLSSKQIKSLQTTISTMEVLEGAYLIMYILGATMTGPQEVIAQEQKMISSYNTGELYTLREQSYLDRLLDTESDNSDDSILDYYEEHTAAYFNETIRDVDAIISRLDA